MSEIQMEITAQGEVVWTVLMHLKNGKISDATACFAENFEFKDRGIGLDALGRVAAGKLPSTRCDSVPFEQARPASCIVSFEATKRGQ